MNDHSRYCDHCWMRDDRLTKVCIKCRRRKGTTAE